MPKPILVILDKDGTLAGTRSGAKFVQSPDDQVLLPGVQERIAELKAAGATIVIASNQGGVAAGHKTLSEAIEEMRVVLRLLPGVRFAVFCSDFEGRECFVVDLDSVTQIAVSAIYDAKQADHWIDERKQLGIKIDNAWAWHKLSGTFRKPGAGMLEYCKHQQVVPGNECYIGDRPEDQQAAAAAGVRFVDAEVWRSGFVAIG